MCCYNVMLMFWLQKRAKNFLARTRFKIPGFVTTNIPGKCLDFLKHPVVSCFTNVVTGFSCSSNGISHHVHDSLVPHFVDVFISPLMNPYESWSSDFSFSATVKLKESEWNIATGIGWIGMKSGKNIWVASQDLTFNDKTYDVSLKH